MITGELKGRVDRVWDAFWSGGISNPLEVIEQITYLLFLRRLDELQLAFTERADALRSRGLLHERAAKMDDELFASLQSRAFWGGR